MQTIRSIAKPSLWFAIAVIVAALLASRIMLIGHHYSDDPNEGWNAWQAAHALGAGPLYPVPGGLTANNYPPLSFYLVGLAGRLVGDPIIAGRWIALFALIAVTMLIVRIVARFSAPRSAGCWTAALLFLALNATAFRTYVAMNDPQWLAHAIATAGLLRLLPAQAGEAPARRDVVIAALLMLVGGLVKHNLVAIPIAATLWIGWRHRPLLLPWLTTAFGGLLVAGVAVHMIYGPPFFADVLGADRAYSWLRMTDRSTRVIAVAAALMIASGRLMRLRRVDSRIDLLLIGIVLSVAIGVVQQSGQGVVRNAFFESAIMLSIACGVALADWEARPGRWIGHPVLWMVAPLLALLPWTMRTIRQEASDRPRVEAAFAAMQARIAATPGPVACQTPALCVWAGKPFAIDFFMYGQHVAVRHDATALTTALATRSIAAIQLDPPQDRLRPGEMANPLPALIEARYRPGFATTDGRRLLLPPPSAIAPLRLATAS